MQIKGIITVFVFLSIVLIVESQNLVPNNSFEDAWSCPSSFAESPVSKPFPQWYNPNKGTPDQFHVCSPGDAGIPENFAGGIYPAEGVAYAGIILREVFYDTTKIVKGVSREYIQTKLTQVLKREKLYCVKLFYANSLKSLYAVDAMGITLTKEKIGTKDAGLIIQRPQVINKPGHIMDNQDYWQELCGTYRARGNEQYLTIGNFWDNSITNYQLNNTDATDTNFIYAYYYIDDVRVFEIENPFECGCLNDLSFGSDWMADNYDPETGYNSLDLSLLADGRSPNDNSSGNDDDDRLNNGNTSINNGTNQNNGDDANGNLGDSSDGDGSNGGNDNNGENLHSGLSFLDMKETEITDVAFNEAKIGDKFNLNRIFFEFNSSELLTASFTELDRLFEIITAKPSLRIEIRGHTDNVGSNSYNKTLSVKRAAAVYDYLIAKGLDKSGLKYRGFGNQVPVADNESEQGRRLNRRVEIIIVEL
ncbi:MAG: OmpA family protein [Bacteroidales bacterium]|nr:OmpA family protein [Bacteroidales bacterium]MDD4215758.1 OmpA family protein [Bacteroidales bacterium]MDY0140365.1 OmpA family protein [Bacteroidales bacterium]